MTNEFNSSKKSKHTLSSAQLELLEALLKPEDGTYPWNPIAPEAEAYFVELEQNFGLEDWSEEEIEVRTQTFYAQIDQIWLNTIPASNTTDVTAINNLQANLQQRFTGYIPQGWLKAIAHQASQALITQQSMAVQLVQCVQELLPSWAEDDLLVLARPFAYTMRGKDTDTIDSVLGNICSQEWKALSEIEQARAGLAIAHYALTQLQSGKC